MSDTLILKLVGIRDTSQVRSLEDSGIPVRTAELARCPHCAVRYWLLVEFSCVPVEQDLFDGEDIVRALLMMSKRITAEHATGHPSVRLSMNYPLQPQWLCKHPENDSRFQEPKQHN